MKTIKNDNQLTNKVNHKEGINYVILNKNTQNYKLASESMYQSYESIIKYVKKTFTKFKKPVECRK